MDLSIIPNYAGILTELQSAWDAVQTSKKMRIVLIEGEGGMKKSLLIREFLNMSHAKCIIGRGSEISEPYLPLRSAYESLLQLDIVQEQLQKPPEEVSQEWKIALMTFTQALQMGQITSHPEWERLKQWQSLLAPSSIDSSFEIAGTSRPINLPELFTFALGDLTAISPVVLFMGNLNITDSSTINAFFRVILPALKNKPLFFITTFEKGRGASQKFFAEGIEAIERMPETARFTLTPLKEEDVDLLVTSESEFRSLIQGWPDEHVKTFVKRLHKLSGGNFSRLQDLLDYVKYSDGKDAAKMLESIPDFTSFLQTRFTQLSEKERMFLQMAACHGFSFCLPVVARALGQPEEEFQSLLAKVAEKSGAWIGIDTTVTSGDREIIWYQFLGRERYELLYNTISENNRTEYHRKIARALEEIYSGSTSGIAGLLAVQFEQGKINAKVAYYLALVAQNANDQGESAQGMVYVQKGLDNLKRIANIPEFRELRCHLLIEKGRAMQGTEQAYSDIEVLREAYELAEELENTLLQANAGRYLGQALLDSGYWDEGIQKISQSLNVVIEQKNWMAVAERMENLRSRYHRRGNAEKFFRLCNEMIKVISEDSSSQAQVAIAEILEDRGWLHLQRNEYDKALPCFEQAFQSLEHLEQPDRYPNIFYKLYRWLARVNRATHEYSQSLQNAEEAIKWAEASHKRRNQVFARYEKTKTLHWSGKIHAAEDELKVALQLLKHSSDLITLGALEEDYGFFLSKTGRKQRAREMYQRSYEHYSMANDFHRIQTARGHLATIDKNLGAFPQALSSYKQLLSEGIALNDKSRYVLYLNHSGDIYRIQNRISEAELAHKRVIRLCDETHDVSRKTITLRYLGQVYLVGWNIASAADALSKVNSLYQVRGGYNKLLYHRTRIFAGRLSLCQGNIQEALTKLDSTAKALEGVQDLLWTGISSLNQGLVHLSAGEPEKAIKRAQCAFEILQATDSWRTSEVHHLLARCYLALGNLERAQSEIDLAKSRFMKLKLFHRVYQAENTEIKIEKAHETGNAKQYQVLKQKELYLDFNHLGI